MSLKTPSPIGIYFTGTLRAAKDKAEAYNLQFQDLETGKYQLSKCIRPQHMHLLESLLRILGKRAFIQRAEDTLPELLVTRSGLARLMFCSDKTIYNLLMRLEEAGFITKKFRGSKFQMTITFNDDIMYIKQRISSKDLEAERNGMELEEAERSLTTLLKRKTLPNIIHTNKTIKTLLNKDVDSLKTTTLDTFHGNESHISKTMKHLNLETPKGKSNSGETTPRCAAPPEIKLTMLDADMQIVHDQCMTLWNYANSRLYKDLKFMASSEMVHGINYFAKALLQFSSPEKRAQKTAGMMMRIELAGRYLDKDAKRYIPIPSKYFDVNNAYGFSTTRLWIKEKLKQDELQAEVNRKARIYQHVQKEMLEVYGNTDFKNISSYTAAVNKIESYQPDLVQGFLAFHLNQMNS